MDELIIKINGQVTTTNFDAWRDQMHLALSRVKTELSTDADFLEAERQAKAFQAAEKKLEQAKLSAQEQSADIHALFRAIDQVKESVRQTRLQLQRQIKHRKSEIRSELIEDAMRRVRTYLAESDTKYKILNASEFAQRHEFETTIKGAAGIPSAQKKLDQLVMEKQREIDARLSIVHANATILEEIAENSSFLFPDREHLLSIRTSSVLEDLIAKRIEDYRQPSKETPNSGSSSRTDSSISKSGAEQSNSPEQDPLPPPANEVQLINLLQTMARGINPLTQEAFRKEEFNDLPALTKALAELLIFIAERTSPSTTVTRIKKPDPGQSVDGGEPTPPKPDLPVPLNYDEELYEKLRTWRFEKTKEKGISAYCIFNNRVFEQIATKYEAIHQPEDLVKIEGIGPAKLEQYGNELLTIIQTHCDHKSSKENSTKPPAKNKHDPSTIKEVLGRDPDDHMPHYVIKSAIDAGIGSSREDTKKLRKGNFRDLRNRNKG